MIRFIFLNDTGIPDIQDNRTLYHPFHRYRTSQPFSPSSAFLTPPSRFEPDRRRVLFLRKTGADYLPKCCRYDNIILFHSARHRQV